MPGTDFNAVVNRRISVTPIHLDLTGRRLLRQLGTWDWPLERAPGAGVAGMVPAGATPSQVEQARIAEET